MKYIFSSLSYVQHEIFFLFDPQLLISGYVIRIGTGDPVCATELSAALVRAEVPGSGPAQGPH